MRLRSRWFFFFFFFFSLPAPAISRRMADGWGALSARYPSYLSMDPLESRSLFDFLHEPAADKLWIENATQYLRNANYDVAVAVNQ
ncbi:hypothetical protein N656DRAFT_783574 [Canariomyces notabilis]|uniref:Uncharacterized protein n=1 Tax=Canariomyces notabilis TaxID=2074819 RepID=A0AAN6QEY7_9PEZI|nr:hypothetical protein N656DRAFT_783574 [Canariomyces arenarius]